MSELDSLHYERILRPKDYGVENIDVVHDQKLTIWHWLDRELQDIDRVYINDLMIANRQRAATDTELTAKINDVALENPRHFYKNLVSQWQKHHQFQEVELLSFIYSLTELYPNGISSIQSDVVDEEFVKLFQHMLDLDYKTLIRSVGIKAHVSNTLDRISQESNLTQNDLLEIVGNIPNYYDLLRISATHDFEQRSVDLAHLGNEQILVQRTNKLPKIKRRIDDSNFRLVYLTQNNGLTDINLRDLSYIRKTLSFDNMEEYLIVSNLEGLSGFALWSICMKVLNDSSVAPNNGNIYGLSTEEISQGLEEVLKSKLIKLPLERPLRQTGDTCSVTVARMILESTTSKKTDSSIQSKLLESSQASREIGGQHFSGIALGIKSLAPQLDVEIVHTAKGRKRFHNGSGNNLALPEDLFISLSNKYFKLLNDAEKLGVYETIEPSLNANFLEKRLLDSRYVILAGQLDYGPLHAILVFGFDPQSGEFLVVDPLEGRIGNKNKAQINKYMSTDIGRWCITVKAKASDEAAD